MDDKGETGNSEKLSEFSRRWYQAHVRRAEADRDYGESGRPSAPRAGGPGQSARGFPEFCTGVRLPTAPAERDARFARLRAELDGDADRFERVATWWKEEKPTFLDPVLVDRCEYGFNNRNEECIESLRSNADAMVAIAAHLGPAMVDHLSVAAGRPLKASRPPVLWTSGGWGRPDLWVDWRVKEGGDGSSACGCGSTIRARLSASCRVGEFDRVGRPRPRRSFARGRCTGFASWNVATARIWASG